MSIEQDFVGFRSRVSAEFDAAKNSVRNLIGDTHWLTDGNHKESLLRNRMRAEIGRCYDVGSGFVCFPPYRVDYDNQNRTTSGQLDLLVLSQDTPPLMVTEEEKLFFVTPSAVRAVAEIKTTLYPGKKSKTSIGYIFDKFAEQIALIRASAVNGQDIWTGVFAFEDSRVSDKKLLETLADVAQGDLARVINCVAIGNNRFYRFWDDGRDVDSVAGPVWHSYRINNLAPAYFICNYVAELNTNIPNNELAAWFPIPGTKERYRQHAITLEGCSSSWRRSR